MSRLPVVLLLLTAVTRVGAQESELFRRLDSLDSASPAPSVAPAKTGTAQEAKGPTEITATKEATYEEKGRKAVFLGDVRVNDPQFKITCDKLTAFLRPSATSAKASPSPSAGGSPTDAPGASGGGLQRAIAEGHVIIIQDKPAESGSAAQHNVGKCQHAEYNADTGDVTLRGWPQVQQGINTQVALDESTVMIMNKVGKTMRTIGPSRMVLKEQSETPPPRRP